MAVRRGGYIKLFRALADSPLWTEEPFTRGQAWADLILLANYKPGHFWIRGNLIHVERGQLGWSAASLARRWSWGQKRVFKFLSDLEKVGQITLQKSNLTTLITITNYHGYQNNDQTDSTADLPADRLADDLADDLHKKKERNKEGKKGTRFARPTLEEVIAYCQKRRNNVDPQKWFNHYTSNGWRVGKNPMRDWKAAVHTWEGNEYGNGKPAAPPAEKPWHALPAAKFAAMEKAGAFAETHRSPSNAEIIFGTTKRGERYKCLIYPLPSEAAT
jgi:hypothetical protein